MIKPKKTFISLDTFIEPFKTISAKLILMLLFVIGVNMDSNACNGPITSFPHITDFEGSVSWVNTTDDDMDWLVLSGSTTSGNTGASAAFEGTYYYYIESSSPNNPSKVANLVSPCYQTSGIPVISFAYHMWGASMGSAEMQITVNDGLSWTTIWSESGDQGNQWIQKTIHLPSYQGVNFKLRVVSTTGTSFTGDFCIDYIVVDEAFGITANLGPDMTNCNDAMFTLTGNTPPAGYNTEWVQVSGFAGYNGDLTSDNPVVFSVPSGTSKVAWRIYKDDYESLDTISLTNDISCATSCTEPLNVNGDLEDEGSISVFDLNLSGMLAAGIDGFNNPTGFSQRYGSNPLIPASFIGAYYLKKTGTDGDPHSGTHMVFLNGAGYCLSPLQVSIDIPCGSSIQFSVWIGAYTVGGGPQDDAGFALEFSAYDNEGVLPGISFGKSGVAQASTSFNDINWTRYTATIDITDQGYDYGDFYFTTFSNTQGILIDDLCIEMIDNGAKADAGDDIVDCSNSFNLQALAASSGYTGQWSIVSGNVTIASPNSPTSLVTINSGSVANLRWTVTDGVCSEYDDVTITYNSLPAISANNDTICSGDFASLTVNNCSNDVLWSTGETTTSISVNPGATTSYTVSCSLPQSGLSIVNPGFESTPDLDTWANWQGSSITTVSSEVYAGSKAAKIDATSAWAGLAKDFPVTPGKHYEVKFWAKSTTTNPVPYFGYKLVTNTWTDIMDYQLTSITSLGYQEYSVTFVAPPDAAFATFYFGGGSPAILYVDEVSVFEGYNCVQEATSIVTVETCLVCDAQVNSPSICYGSSAILVASGGASYAWSNGLSGSSIVVQPSVTTDYIVTVTTVDGCIDVDTATVTVNPELSVAIDYSGSVCFDENGILQALVSGGSPSYSYNWTGPNGFTSTAQSFTIPESGNYYVTITDAASCTKNTSAFVYDEYDVFITTLSTNVCEGESVTLSVNSNSATTYQWSANAGNATSSQVTVTPSAPASTYQVTVTNDQGCTDEASVTINVIGKPIITLEGASSICEGETTSFSPSTGGTWTSLNPSVATITNTGIVTAISPGIATFTFESNSTGCVSDPSISITILDNNDVSITGPNSICPGETTTLSPTVGGTWESSNTLVATVNASGIVTGIASGTATFRFTDGSNGCISEYTAPITVKSKPIVSITGNTTICEGSTTQLSPTNGGTWTSSNTTIATVNAAGVVTGLSAGTVNFTFTANNGCVSDVTGNITIIDTPTVSISGPTDICIGGYSALSASVAGGSWASSNVNVAAIINGNQVIGVGIGSATFTYTSPNGCLSNPTATINVTDIVDVNISGPSSVCQNSTITLVSSSNSGTWSSSNNAIATVSSTGIVTGVAPGNVIISYNHPANSCFEDASKTITVLSKPTISLSGPSTICIGGQTYFNFSGTGTWTSSNASVAVITNTGIVTGIGQGTVVFTFTSDNGCSSNVSETVTVAPSLGVSIDFNGNVCLTDTSKLTAIVSGGTPVYTYYWTGPAGFTSNQAVIDIPTNGNYYVTVTDANGCQNSTSGFVYQKYEPFIFTLNTSVCDGEDITLSVNSSTAVAYQWSTNAGNSTLPSVTVTPVLPSSQYVVTVTNDKGCQSSASANIGVYPKPTISLLGQSLLCEDETTNFSPSSGGTWSSSNPSVATINNGGVVTAVGAGSAVFTFVTNDGCASDPSIPINVVGSPDVEILGDDEICVGQTTSVSSTSAGFWYSSQPSVAYINAQGIITAVNPGTTVISFVESTNGCPGDETFTIIVSPKPTILYQGPSTVCQGDTSQMVPSSGGTWISSNPNVATIDNSGKVVAINSGTTTFTFTSNFGCISSPSGLFTVNPKPTINVPSNYEMCVGEQLYVTPNTGGQWFSNNPAVATISNAGLIQSVGPGTTTFYYVKTSTSCASNDSPAITVLAGQDPTITGDDRICVGETTTLSPTSGGVWISSNPNIATIANNGLVTAIAAGVVEFTFFDNSSNCPSAFPASIIVDPKPNVVFSGPTTICVGEVSSVLPSSGGVWTSSNVAVAIIDANGIITGIGAGIATFSFTSNVTGCSSVTPTNISVYEIPDVQVTGGNNICIGQTTTLSPTFGGVWTSSNPSIATVSSNGMVTGITQGTVTFTFMENGSGCVSNPTTPVNILAKPNVSITGPSTICEGSTTTLSPTTGGTWISLNPSIATVNNNGVVIGISQGLTRFVFTSDNGCSSNQTAPVVVNGKLDISFNGLTSICVDDQIQIYPIVQGIWTSSNTNVATINNTGMVTAIAPGTVTFIYEDPVTSCVSDASQILTIEEPPIISIYGPSAICIGETTNIAPSVGGTWTSLNPLIASIDNGGNILGLSAGIARFIFTSNLTGCSSDTSDIVLVEAGPDIDFIGPTTLCIGDTTYMSPSFGGTWVSNNNTVATINNQGMVIALQQGSARFTFTDNYSGCSSELSAPLIVNGVPSVNVVGDDNICIGNTTTLYPSSGGIWESLNPSIASVTAGGLVTGLSAGTAYFAFTNSNTGCVSDGNLSVVVNNSTGFDITGENDLCVGYTLSLMPSSGGMWVSSNPKIATISASGIVTGKAPGKVTFEFIDTGSGCSTGSVSDEIEVTSCVNNDFNVTLVGVPVTSNVSINDVAPLGTTYGNNTSIVTKPSGSLPLLVVNPDGTYTFTPDKVGKYIYKVPVCIPPVEIGCYSTLLEITVVGDVYGSSNPVANLEFTNTIANNNPSLAGASVDIDPLANDRCIYTGGCLLGSLSIVDNGSKGTAILGAGDILTYTPQPGQYGLDTITYTVCTDGGLVCSTTSQIIMINHPSASNTLIAADDFDYGIVGNPIIGNVIANDYDADGDDIQVTAQGSISNPIAINGGSYYIDQAGLYTFTPDANFNGNTEFVYTICDDAAIVNCRQATVHIMVLADMSIKLRVYLEGALYENGNALSNTGKPLMRDNLRFNPLTGVGYLPKVDPYTVSFATYATSIDITSKYSKIGPALLSQNQIIGDSLAVFGVTGQNAIVDWVFIELRSKNNMYTKIATRAALLQRDGDVVDLDGVSDVKFQGVNADSFFVVVKHRNHMGVMSNLVSNDELVDFTNPSFGVFNFGTTLGNGRDYTGLSQNANVKIGYHALWAGDLNSDGYIKFVGDPTDVNVIFEEILFASVPYFLSNYNFAYGYTQGDFDLNGKVKFTNPNDDTNLLYGQLIFYPLNTDLKSNFGLFIEQVPRIEP